MIKKKTRHKGRNGKRLTGFGLWILVVVCVSMGIYVFLGKEVKVQFERLISFWEDRNKKIMLPSEMLELYTLYINEHKYDEMYALLNNQSKENISQEEFVLKNKKIYEGIEASNLKINISDKIEQDEIQMLLSYETTMDTVAGEISFSNKARFTKNEEKEYGLLWYPGLIFPGLNTEDKVRLNTVKAERGSIYDRNGKMLAGKGVASSIGLVPGKMGANKETDIAKISELLGVSVEDINKKLDAVYVKEDTFVPIKKISKGQQEIEEALLRVKGIKITDVAVRVYPFGEETSHLTGYIQNVNAEDLDRLQGQAYNGNSVIGRAGLEKIYEEHLRGIDGCEIVILSRKNRVKQTLAKKSEKNGKNIILTLDAEVQSVLYNQFSKDKSCSVAMNPKTGEVLALVSTPSFDSNDFVLGMTQAKWELLNNDLNKPLYNRFKAALCPGSGFKSVIAGIGLTTGKIHPSDNYANSGLSWQKDASWGGYKVTTLKDYGDQVVLRNALIYSDNIYFAKAALNIGRDVLAEQLINIGFDETIPFEVGLYSSSFSNTGTFDSEIQLADSGYGQAQILINPIHMASIYSAFVNDGSMIKPYLIYNTTPEPKYWKKQVFTKEAAKIVCDDLIQVVEQGSGGLAKIEGITLAGKTGTAEIKQSKKDQEGTELGWFNIFTVDENVENSLLIVTMAEDVKGRGGAGYVIPKVKEAFKPLQ